MYKNLREPHRNKSKTRLLSASPRRTEQSTWESSDYLVAECRLMTSSPKISNKPKQSIRLRTNRSGGYEWHYAPLVVQDESDEAKLRQSLICRVNQFYQITSE